MSRTLYFHIDAGWPHQHLNCPWSLFEGERAVSTGHDAPNHWPPANDHVLILSPAQVVYHSVKLPPKVHWNDATAVAMALEDRLVDDLERVVVIPLHQQGEEVICCTIKRQRLEQLLASMQELGRPLARIEALSEKLPSSPDVWRIFQHEDGLLWMHDGMIAMELDAPVLDTDTPVALTLRRAQAATELPASLVVHGASSTLLQGLEAEWGVPLQRVAALDWRTTLSRPSSNLLQGDWMPRRKLMAEPAFKTAMLVVAACMCIQTLIFMASVGKTWWSIRGTKSEQVELWKEVSGSTDAADKPVRRLQQVWQAARAKVGESQPGEFVPLLAALGQQLPQAKITTLNYEQGRLIVSFGGTPKDANALETGLKEQGYTAVTQSASNGNVTMALMAKESP